MNDNSQIVRKTFQNLKKVNVFEKVHEYKLNIKLNHPKEPQSISYKHMKLNRAN